MELVTTQIEKLEFDPANPRNHSEKNLNAIRASIEEHGQVEPLIVHKKNNVVIGGNARLAVMKDLGYTEVQTVLLDCDDDQARKLSIVLNRTGELAGWNTDALAAHLLQLGMDGEFNPESLGFSAQELESILAEFDEAVESIDIDEPGERPIPTAPDYDDSGNDGPGQNIKQVTLFFNDDTHSQVVAWARLLAKHFGTKTMTDTVYQSIQELVANLELE